MTSPIDVEALEQRLAPLSHGVEALTILRDTLKRLGPVVARQDFLNERLLCAPITFDAVKGLDPANVVRLDPFAQCGNETLAFAERRASMTVLGWRVFGALLRAIGVREAAEEVAIRRRGPRPR